MSGWLGTGTLTWHARRTQADTTPHWSAGERGASIAGSGPHPASRAVACGDRAPWSGLRMLRYVCVLSTRSGHSHSNDQKSVRQSSYRPKECGCSVFTGHSPASTNRKEGLATRCCRLKVGTIATGQRLSRVFAHHVGIVIVPPRFVLVAARDFNQALGSVGEASD